MALNPMKLMKLKERIGLFKTEHQKALPFMRRIRDTALEEGTILELSAVKPDGTKVTGNICLTANDVETFRMLLSSKYENQIQDSCLYQLCERVI